MKDYNFNALQNLPVPVSWIENALSIPEKVDRETAAVPFWRKPRFIATAASILLVTALSVGLYLSFGTGSPVPVKPSATGSVQSTDADASEFSDTSTGGDRQDNTEPTEQKSAFDRIVERIYDSRHNTSPTTSTGSDRRGRTSPTTKASPTESGRRNPSQKPGPSGGNKPAATTAPIVPATEPGVTPTEKPIPPTEKPVSPTASPTVRPTERQPYEPWYPPTEMPWEQPTESPWEQPTRPQEPIHHNPKRRVLYVSIPQEEVPSDGNIYCRLTVDGEVLGDDDPYADGRRMTFLAYGTSYTFYYVISDHIAIPAAAEGKTATYEVYDSSGNLLKTGSYQLR